VKELWKSVKIWQSYRYEFGGPLFLEHSVECGPVLNVIAALPNIGGALCSSPQTLADAHYQSAVQ